MEIEYCVGLACGWKYLSKDGTSEGECLKHSTVNPPTLLIGTIIHLREYYQRGANSSWEFESRTPLVAHYILDLTCSLSRCNSPTMGQLIYEIVWEHYSLWQNFSYYLKKSFQPTTRSSTSTASVTTSRISTRTTTQTTTISSITSSSTTIRLNPINATMIERKNAAHIFLPFVNLIIFSIFVISL